MSVSQSSPQEALFKPRKKPFAPSAPPYLAGKSARTFQAEAGQLLACFLRIAKSENGPPSPPSPRALRSSMTLPFRFLSPSKRVAMGSALAVSSELSARASVQASVSQGSPETARPSSSAPTEAAKQKREREREREREEI